MARTITAQRPLQIRDTRNVFRIEAEVAGGQVSSVAAHCEHRFVKGDGTVLGKRPGYVTIRRQWAQLGAPMRTLFSSLVTRANRPALFRIQIEVAEDESFVVTAHASDGESQVLDPGPAQISGIAALINYIDGENDETPEA
jgi:hypothetical protein